MVGTTTGKAVPMLGLTTDGATPASTSAAVIGVEDGQIEHSHLGFAVKIESPVPTRDKLGVGVFGDHLASEVEADMSMIINARRARLRPAGERQGPWSSGGGRDARSNE